MSKISNRDIANALNYFVRAEHRSVLFGTQMPAFWTKQDFPSKSYVASKYCQLIVSFPYIDEVLGSAKSSQSGIIELNNAVVSSIGKARVLLDYRLQDLLREMQDAGFALNFGLSHTVMYQGVDGMSIELVCDVTRVENPDTCALVKYTKGLKQSNLI